jgi:uncharacterized protein YkwD
MLTRARIVCSLLAFAAACAVASPAAGGISTGQRGQAAALATRVVVQLNAVRAQRGLAPLRLSRALAAAAALHSREMAQNGYFEHRSADGSPFWKRIERYYPSGRSSVWKVGENLLWLSPSVDAPTTLRMWMESPEHRRNVLDHSWHEVGISTLHVSAAPGFFHGLEVTIVTADFGFRKPL